MRFHVLGFPFTQTNKDWCECAYTQKILNFCKMMTSRGHDVIHYGVEGSEVQGEHVTVMSLGEHVKFCGPRDKAKLSDMDWNPESKLWRTFNGNCISGILPRVEKEDFVCHIAGRCSQAVARAITDAEVFNVEYGIGYKGTFASCRAFESYAQMHQQWQREKEDPNGINYDVTIPNYYDLADFPVGKGDGDYLLFVGRIILRKGLEIAFRVARATGMKLIVAGQGAQVLTESVLLGDDGTKYSGCKFEYLGHVDTKRRAELRPRDSDYGPYALRVEPFGGVNVEAQLCGTPAITSDWGGFVDTVEHGRTGYRCRTLGQYIWAAKNAGKLNRAYTAMRARSKWSLERVGEMYEEWFSMIKDRWREGWNSLRSDARSMAWLNDRPWEG